MASSSKGKARPPRLKLSVSNDTPATACDGTDGVGAGPGGGGGGQGRGGDGSWEVAAGLPPIHSPASSPHNGRNPVLPQTVRSPKNHSPAGERTGRSWSTSAKARGFQSGSQVGNAHLSGSGLGWVVWGEYRPLPNTHLLNVLGVVVSHGFRAWCSSREPLRV